MSSAYWAADAIATNLEAINDRRRSEAALATAQSYHRGTIAQLSAALSAIQKLDSTNALNWQAVLDVIDRDGENANTFREAWRLDHDPEKILVALRVQFESGRIAKLEEVRAMPIKTNRKGWFWNRHDIFVFANVTHSTMQSAEAAKLNAVHFLANSRFGDDLNGLS